MAGSRSMLRIVQNYEAQMHLVLILTSSKEKIIQKALMVDLLKSLGEIFGNQFTQTELAKERFGFPRN